MKVWKLVLVVYCYQVCQAIEMSQKMKANQKIRNVRPEKFIQISDIEMLQLSEQSGSDSEVVIEKVSKEDMDDLGLELFNNKTLLKTMSKD